MLVSAVIPTYNNEATIARAIERMRAQTLQPDELLVLDDGSTDGTISVVESLCVPYIIADENRGRGYIRARSMEVTQHPYVLSCDATVEMGPRFLEDAMLNFKDPKVAAVMARMQDPNPKTVAERWRARHLFRQEDPWGHWDCATLKTGAVVLRKEAIMSVGNFDKTLREAEDLDMDSRLATALWKIVIEPKLEAFPMTSNTLFEVFDRYIRWNAEPNKKMAVSEYMRQIWYSMKVMALKDLKKGDILPACASLLFPHYQYFKR